MNSIRELLEKVARGADPKQTVHEFVSAVLEDEDAAVPQGTPGGDQPTSSPLLGKEENPEAAGGPGGGAPEEDEIEDGGDHPETVATDTGVVDAPSYDAATQKFVAASEGLSKEERRRISERVKAELAEMGYDFDDDDDDDDDDYDDDDDDSDDYRHEAVEDADDFADPDGQKFLDDDPPPADPMEAKLAEEDGEDKKDDDPPSDDDKKPDDDEKEKDEWVRLAQIILGEDDENPFAKKDDDDKKDADDSDKKDDDDKEGDSDKKESRTFRTGLSECECGDEDCPDCNPDDDKKDDDDAKDKAEAIVAELSMGKTLGTAAKMATKKPAQALRVGGKVAKSFAKKNAAPLAAGAVAGVGAAVAMRRRNRSQESVEDHVAAAKKAMRESRSLAKKLKQVDEQNPANPMYQLGTRVTYSGQLGEVTGHNPYAGGGYLYIVALKGGHSVLAKHEELSVNSNNNPKWTG